MNLDRFGFKAKSNQRGNYWLYASLDFYDGIGSYGVRYHLEPGGDTAFSPAGIKPETLCQCTGLKDSEGNLIYENDILEIEIPHGKDNGVVYYQELDTSFRVWQEAFTMGLALVIEHIRTMGWKVKVIGNKFDKEDNNA